MEKENCGPGWLNLNTEGTTLEKEKQKKEIHDKVVLRKKYWGLIIN